VSLHPIHPHDPGPSDGAGRGDETRGARTRVKVLTWGWAAVLAALVITVVYLAWSPYSRPARRVSLGEAAGRSRAIGFGPGGEVLAATMFNETIRLWRIDPGSGPAVPVGPAVPGLVAALAPDGAALAVGGLAAVTVWDGDPDRPRRTLPTGDGPTSALPFRRVPGRSGRVHFHVFRAGRVQPGSISRTAGVRPSNEAGRPLSTLIPERKPTMASHDRPFRRSWL
jgi:hypothetical protein